MAAKTAGRDVTAELAFLTRALKAPTLREAVPRLADRARAENWTHEEFLVACLQREVSARESHGGEGRIRAARFPARKSLEEFDFDHARGLRREVIAHLGTLDFAVARENVVGLPGRAPGAVRDRRRMGRPARRRPPRRPPPRRTPQTRQIPAAGHRPMPTPQLCRGPASPVLLGVMTRWFLVVWLVLASA